MLQALKIIPRRSEVLFPLVSDVAPNTNITWPTTESEIQLYNRLLESNAEQIQAVKKVTQLSPGNPPFIIFGP